MSVLAAQLAQLAGLKGPQEKWVRGKASLLFNYQQAADVGADTLLSIAQTGALAQWVLIAGNSCSSSLLAALV
jgi:hypothetical protein